MPPHETTTSSVHRPYLLRPLPAGMFFIFGSSIIMAGFCFLLFGQGQNIQVNDAMRLVMLGSPLGGILTGVWILCSACWECIHPCEIQSIDSIDGVPSQPVCEDKLTSFSTLSQEWVPGHSRGVFRRSAHSHGTRRVAMSMVFVAAVWIAVVWGIDLPIQGIQPILLVCRLLASIVVLVVIAVVVTIADSHFKERAERFPTCELDRLQGVCILEFNGGRLSIPLSDVVGVQLCLCLRSLGSEERVFVRGWCMELNLVWKSHKPNVNKNDVPSAPSPDSSMEFSPDGICGTGSATIVRKTLSLVGGRYRLAAEAAFALAEALRVPLINNATRADFEKEKEVSQNRAPVSGGFLG